MLHAELTAADRFVARMERLTDMVKAAFGGSGLRRQDRVMRPATADR
jgi:hypothetical protein